MGALSNSQLRIRLDLAYDGTFFHGWAAQDGPRTVQGVLTQALSTILRRPVILTHSSLWYANPTVPKTKKNSTRRAAAHCCDG